MSLPAVQEYLSIGGNRQTAASAWCARFGVLAYGSDQNVALWKPLFNGDRGVHQILQGHNDKVTAIAFADSSRETSLLSGAADGNLMIHELRQLEEFGISSGKVKAHDGAVNIIAATNDSSFFVTGGADALIKVWKIAADEVRLVTVIRPKPRLIPLALAVGSFPNSTVDQGFFLAVAGTRNDVQIYALSSLSKSPSATLTCSLTGHEGWIRSLALRKIESGGYILASTSHDKYVRLWRFQAGDAAPQQNGLAEKEVVLVEQTLTAKVKTVSIGEKNYSITFEALLLGHEDWVYSADWQDTAEERLLTASADGTLAIWEPDPASGIWVSETRLGEISGQKGATTATGSSGGFWTGMWICGKDTMAVVSLGRTGSWRMWLYDPVICFWNLKHGVGGHTDSVNGLCWSPFGEYLLSTSSDQTTRLHAEWRRDGKRTWHEFSRCQIHGYNCNVVSCISSYQFASGADEKLLRVFNEPKELADTLHRLCGIAIPQDKSLPETAAIPVLGLSNKEMGEPDDIIEAGPRRGDDDYAAASALAGISIKDISEPPTEDLLSRHTLWPEHEKLYGHGYEISESAYKDGILATACKASSVDHATIRLYDPENDWREIKPPLTAHSLTVTRIAWSKYPQQYLLSVGRDRQWTVFKRIEGKNLELYQAMPKAHTRMILDATWSPIGNYPFFATAGRDKTVKLWSHNTSQTSERNSDGNPLKRAFELCTTLTRPSAVTAIDMTCDLEDCFAILAVGEEDGTISIHTFEIQSLKLQKSVDLDKNAHLSKSINRLAWRPHTTQRRKDGPRAELAVAGADGSVRILGIDIMSLC